MSELAFFGRFTGETARVCSGFPSLKSDDVAREALDLHQRHGQAIWDVLKAAVENHSAELVKRGLPPSSVLMMTVAPSGAPALAPVMMRAGAVETWIGEAEAESAYGDHRGGAYVADQSPDGAPKPSRTGRAKSQPALERARGVIKELYLNGVPGQAAEPNANLCRRVGERLKQTGLPGVSDDTILRAAGRRK